MRKLTQADIDEVFNAAKLFAKKHPHVQWEDYVTSGYVGMTQAAETWNKELGASFKNHAYRRMKGAMLDQYRQEYGRNRPNEKKSMSFTMTEPIAGRDFVSVEPINTIDERDEWNRITKDMDRTDKMICAMLADGFRQVDASRACGLCESAANQRIASRIKPLLKERCAA